MSKTRMFTALIGAIALSFVLSACSPVVSLQAADSANDPACAAVTVRLPDTVDGLASRSTDAQATGAWGTPAAVLLRCGLAPVAVSTLKCVTEAGVDWLIDDTKAPTYRFITFARTPAIEVVVDSTKAAGVNVLDDLVSAVSQIAATDHCVG
ncbi:MAG: hypothetical protein RLZZ164_871 [Actinomycetota bacterium]|jgi:hypothetical protein